MPECVFCSHVDDVSIVPHIREKHNLKTYLNLFPDLPIVNNKLYTAIENTVFFGYKDDTPGLDSITPAEMELILVSSRNNAHLRSEIIQTQDF
jgi:hypothetical protein